MLQSVLSQFEPFFIYLRCPPVKTLFRPFLRCVSGSVCRCRLATRKFFSNVLLRMADNPQKTCPFLIESGCRIYLDRPDTCRTFPIEQGMLYDADRKKETPAHFFRPPDFCLGHYEKKEWTIPSWTRDQEAELYLQMKIRWAGLKQLFQKDP